MHIPEDEAERRRLNERGREILRRKNGAVRPHREDGYVNLLNKYGTKQDNSEAYKFEREPVIPDMQLTGLYEGNGLFSKIIDTPAEEALKHGFDLNLKSDEVNAFVEDALDDLEWEEKAATAIKWARLYGGALIVMLIDEGGGRGVGFRYRARYAAQSLGLTGWVENEDDGSVTLEVQGDPDKFMSLFAMIQKSDYIQITSLRQRDLAPDPWERDFRVRGCW